MNLNSVLKKAWGMLWQYRAVWLFGAILALFSLNILYPIEWLGEEEGKPWTRIQVTDGITIKVPGVDMTIDLTAPGGMRISTPYTVGWPSFSDMVYELNRDALINLKPILVEAGVMLAGAIVLGTVLRYVAETALIHMVDETGQTGKRLGFWEGLRSGWSRRAWRLFLLDLICGGLVSIGFVVVFGLAAAPILLALSSNELVLLTVGVSTAGLLALASCIGIVAALVLSLVLQPIRRACVLEDQSLGASIRQGARLTRRHFKEAGLLWLVWMGIRLLWSLVGTVVVILLAPALFVTFLLAVVLGGIPIVVIAMVAHVFMSGLTPWLMGALAGLPVFMVVLVSPVLLVSGWVEIYKSAIWTLAYRDLKALEISAREPVRAPQGLTVSGPAD